MLRDSVTWDMGAPGDDMGRGKIGSYVWVDWEGVKRGPLLLITQEEEYVRRFVAWIPLVDVLILLEGFGHSPRTMSDVEYLRKDTRAQDEVRGFLLDRVLKWRLQQRRMAVERRLSGGGGVRQRWKIARGVVEEVEEGVKC